MNTMNCNCAVVMKKFMKRFEFEHLRQVFQSNLLSTLLIQWIKNVFLFEYLCLLYHFEGSHVHDKLSHVHKVYLNA